MAAPNAELQRKLAKRRSFGEQVFEHEAAPSSADVTSGTGAEASTAATTLASKAAGDLQRESESSAAYKVALERIREFERRGAQSKGTLLGRGRGIGSMPIVKGSKAADVTSTAKPSQATCESDHSAASDSDRGAGDSRRQGAPGKQEDFKSLVQLRFAALIREGLMPNEAAARAILEAAGQQADTDAGLPGCGGAAATAAEGGNGHVAGARSNGSAASSPGSPRSECSRRSCASSAKGKEATSKRSKNKKAVAVLA